MKLMLRRLIVALGVVVLVIGSYVGWQIYRGQQLANQYAAEAQKLDGGSGDGTGAQGSDEPSSAVPPSLTSPSVTGTQPNASAASPSSTPSNGEYKKLMSKSYQQTLQAMQDVKGNTTALQGRKMSLSAYKASIVQAQAAFTAAEAFAKANPPTEATLKSSYQDYLAGIGLARQAMGVVLNGISSFNVSKIYAAREMGITAQRQLTGAYGKF